MRRLKFSALFAAIMLAPAATALAADVVRPYVPAPAGGWYIRADVGHKWYRPMSAIFDAPSYGPGYVVPGNGELFNETMSSAWVVGGGVGYDPVGPHRFDFTLDYETPSHFYGRLDCTTCVLAPGYSEETANITAWTGLANIYLDFAGHPNWTPYVGAGAGFSALTTSNVATSEPAGPYPGATHWNFAWALMAGFTHDISSGLKLDVNYRYVNLGEARSGVLDDGLGHTGFIQYQNISAHEIRIGFRHML